MHNPFRKYFRARDLDALMFNHSFGVLTKEAFQLLLKRIITKDTALVAFDIDNLKTANTTLGKEEVNRRLHAAFSSRSADVILGQTFSGDEFAALVNNGDAYGFAVRLKGTLHKVGLSATIVIADYEGESTFITTEDKISEMKTQGNKDTILDMRKPKQ
jgi:GGDEF domain-containing protein